MQFALNIDLAAFNLSKREKLEKIKGCLQYFSVQP